MVNVFKNKMVLLLFSLIILACNNGTIKHVSLVDDFYSELETDTDSYGTIKIEKKEFSNGISDSVIFFDQKWTNIFKVLEKNRKSKFKDSELKYFQLQYDVLFFSKRFLSYSVVETIEMNYSPYPSQSTEVINVYLSDSASYLVKLIPTQTFKFEINKDLTESVDISCFEDSLHENYGIKKGKITLINPFLSKFCLTVIDFDYSKEKITPKFFEIKD